MILFQYWFTCTCNNMIMTQKNRYNGFYIVLAFNKNPDFTNILAFKLGQSFQQTHQQVVIYLITSHYNGRFLQRNNTTPDSNEPTKCSCYC